MGIHEKCLRVRRTRFQWIPEAYVFIKKSRHYQQAIAAPEVIRAMNSRCRYQIYRSWAPEHHQPVITVEKNPITVIISFTIQRAITIFPTARERIQRVGGPPPPHKKSLKYRDSKAMLVRIPLNDKASKPTFKQSLQTGVFPDCWNISNVWPIPKSSGNRSSISTIDLFLFYAHLRTVFKHIYIIYKITIFSLLFYLDSFQETQLLINLPICMILFHRLLILEKRYR